MAQETSIQKNIPQVTKDMTIGDVVRKYPQAIEPLQAAGVHCVGCHVSYVETLEQGFKGHGKSDTEIDSVVENINLAIASSPDTLSEEKPFIITKKAAEKLQEVLAENNETDSGLRVEIVPGGCSGFQYGLELEQNPIADDIIIAEHGVKIFIAPDNMQFLKGAKLDYVESLQGGGFKITNPNVRSGCGCGQSFEY